MDYPYSRQAPADSTPTAVVQRVFDALDAKRWGEVVALVDPSELERFAAEQVEAVRRSETAPSVVEMLRGRSSLAPEVLDRHALAEEASRRDRRARLAQLYGGRSTSQEVAQLTPEALFLLWLAGSDPAERIRQAAAQVEQEHPGFTEAVLQGTPYFRREIVRTEYPRADLARVTYREWFAARNADDTPDAELRVATLRRTVAGWRMEVDAELMGHTSFAAVVERTGM